MQCDLCGKESQLFKTLIEGVEMRVCKDCSSFGKVVSEAGPAPTPHEMRSRAKPKTMPHAAIAKPEEEATIEIIRRGYPGIIKKERERRGMTQKEFAAFLQEKENLIHKIETGSFEPGIEMAKKLERKLGLKLVESYEEKKVAGQASGGGQITIGDILKVRKRN